MTEKTILVVVDLHADDEQPVLDRAAWLAARFGAGVELFGCDYDPDIDAGYVATVWIPQPDARDQLMLKYRAKLDALAKPLRDRGLSVSIDLAWDHPFDAAIVRKTAASAPWLVAKGTRHHNILQRTLLSNTDWHLIRDCPAPLLLVKDRALNDPPRVLAAVDPTHEHDKPAHLDDRILDFAATLAGQTHGELHVLHAAALPVGLELPPDVTEVDLMASRTSRDLEEPWSWSGQPLSVRRAGSRLLEGAQHHGQVTTLELGRHPVDVGHDTELVGHPLQQVEPILRSPHFPHAEHDGDLDVLALLEELPGTPGFGFEIVDVDVGSELDLFDVDLMLLLLGFAGFLFLLVPEAPVVHDLTHNGP